MQECFQKIFDKFSGWSRILFDKCNYNYTTDIHVVNQPSDLASNSKKP